MSGGEAVKVTPGAGDVRPRVDGPRVAVLRGGPHDQPGPGALWRLPLHGGAPGKLVEGVNTTSFEVIDNGVYYLERVAGETKLRYFDFATRQSTLVAGNLGTVSFGLTASRDGRTILYSRVGLFGQRSDAGGQFSLSTSRASRGFRN